jgi:hypothetical protein
VPCVHWGSRRLSLVALMKTKNGTAARRAFLLVGLLTLIGAGSSQGARPEPASYELLPTGTDGPHLFAEGVISTPDDEAGGVFSPDGKEFYFAKLNPTTTFPKIGLLCVSRWQNGKWATPEVLPFSGKYLDFPPRLSPDGQAMYFASSRPVPGIKTKVMRIWKTEKTAEGWSEPQPLPAPINSPEDSWNWGASVTKDGTLYFASDREERGRPKIYRSRLVNGTYQEPQKVAEPINSDFSDYDPFINADETILFFVSAGDDAEAGHHREGTLFTGGYPYPRGDIYCSRSVGGKWTAARHLEHGVNTVADENSPALTPDGKQLMFTSERSPFTVPMRHKLTMKEYEEHLHGTLNGHGNIYSIPVGALDITKEE